MGSLRASFNGAWRQRKEEIAQEVRDDLVREVAYWQAINGVKSPQVTGQAIAEVVPNAIPDPQRLLDKALERKEIRIAPNGDIDLPDHQRSTEYALERSVRSRYRALAQAVGDVGVPPPPPMPEKPDPAPRAPRDWEAALDSDRWNNIAESLWRLQSGQDDPQALDFETWNEVIVGRGLLRLLAYFPRGRHLLASLYRPNEFDSIPTQEDAARFLTRHPLPGLPDREDEPTPETELDGQRFIAALYAEVPWSKRAVHRLLAAYKQAVVTHRRGTDHGSNGLYFYDDLYIRDPEPVTFDQLMRAVGREDVVADTLEDKEARMERAITAFVAGVPLRTAAKQLGVSRRALQEELDQRGIKDRSGRRRKEVNA